MRTYMRFGGAEVTVVNPRMRIPQPGNLNDRNSHLAI
jgi:hypothetical protein